ncbi:MAG TPA: cyclodeaminase/cyclohydrolase family protein [Vicinamibacterales bacterium]|nr:cyclodeaminase/cyclohydrolase family protein [Vicinamibacterales bacterium]
MLIDKPARELIDAFASSDPTPGGGSASALAAAVGAGLLQMVASLPKTRTTTPGDDADRVALGAASATLTGIRSRLTAAVDADSSAYDQVVGAYKLPKATDAEKSARKSAIQRALRGATDVPLGVARLSVDALKEARTVAAHGHRGAASDVGVAIALLRAGQRGAALNVEINLGGIEDSAYVAAVRSELHRLEDEAAAAAAAAEGLLQS